MSNQYLKLRRSNVQGRIPTTESIDFGEIALNTYDGLAYMKKSGSNGIEVVPIGSPSGSFSGTFTGTFSGSFSGSGANLFGIPASGIVGLNLSQISSGSYSASISENGLLINTRVVADSFTGSLFGTASWAKNYNETDPIFTAVSGTLATTGSNTFRGNQIISGSGINTILQVHGANAEPWAFGIYNDTYNPSQSVLAGFIDNTGEASIGTEVNKPLYIYTNANYSNPTLIISSSGVTIDNTLTVNNGITGSLQGTASWANNALTSSFITSSNIYGPFGSNSVISASYALSASHASVASSVTTLNQNVTISGSLTVTDNFTVLGSASITYISESTLNIGTNLITVNTINPGARFGGLAVIDSGSSPQISASFLYDSIKDEFVFVHHSIPTTSSVFLQGPETYNDLGNEIYLTANRIPKGTGIEHLNDSNISDDGSVVSINSNTQITGSLTVSNGITGSFSGSGANLYDIPASGIVGLNLSQISSGSVSASVSPAYGFAVNGLSAGTGSSHVIMYNTASGQFFFTGSSAIGGGNASNDNFQQIFLLMGG